MGETLELIITEEDCKNIEEAKKQGGNVWENELLGEFKKKIKKYNLGLQNKQCCYCRKPFADEFKMVIDIEHVLPKGKYSQFMFTILNLSVSCKRCNMRIKGEDESFIINALKINDDYKLSTAYKFIHPNLDIYADHLKFYLEIVDTKKIIKYQVNNQSEKGAYTYEYFELHKIEEDALNSAQGITLQDKISPKIPTSLSQEFKDLLGID